MMGLSNPGVRGATKPSAPYKGRMERYADDTWLIWSNKWNSWYRPGSHGYTTIIENAGLFTRAEASEHMREGEPKKYRTTEPFPLSSVKSMVEQRIADIEEERERLAREITKLKHFIETV